MASEPKPLEAWVQSPILLRQALTHSSYANEGQRREAHNERLEFLGDSVLQLVVTEWLYQANPTWPEGRLSQARAAIVCEPTLAEAAERLQVGSHLYLGRGEERSGGRRKASLLADAVEAIIGAIYLDGGLDRARAFIHAYLDFALTTVEMRETGRDHKTALGEFIRKRGGEVQYTLVQAFGPDHDKTFEIELTINGRAMVRAVGRSKKEAEQQCARLALKQLLEEAGGPANPRGLATDHAHSTPP
jgi:ribonuclease-3